MKKIFSTLSKRQGEYGSPGKSHRAIATAWSWWLSASTDTQIRLTPVDVAAMMALLKLARLANSTDEKSREDSILDLGGYAVLMANLEKGDDEN